MAGGCSRCNSIAVPGIKEARQIPLNTLEDHCSCRLGSRIPLSRCRRPHTSGAAVITIPASGLAGSPTAAREGPIHLMVHSSLTGECPSGQWSTDVIYGSMAAARKRHV
ncbi:hypothetical protein MRB53_038401 [Persea americana]|nr:hypothetical protein MRB53_038401 [Persea americana]